jgi:response regulator RpfG family c-di-GMP phosphodiesterase
MHTEKEILAKIIRLGQEISQINDVDFLLEKILTESRNFVNADAGSIFIKTEESLTFSYAQNNTLQKELPEGKKLIYSAFTLPVNNTSIAGYVANTGGTVNITDVYKLPPETPYSFSNKFDELSHYKTQSVLSFPLKTPQDEILGVLQLINAKDNNNKVISFNKEDEPFILHFANSAAIALERAQMTRAIILRMLKMAEMRDPKETGAHVNRVGAYSVEIYEAWAVKKGINRKEIEKNKDILRIAAMLHDVGKVAISDVILKKPAKLDFDEFEIMKQHSYLGAKLFSEPKSDLDKAAYHIALEHHERWDGKGYPGNVRFVKDTETDEYKVQIVEEPKMAGNNIHLFGRIVAIADVFDALCSRRCYKEPWDDSKVIDILNEEKGKQFDPDIVDAFFEVLDVIKNHREKYKE